MQNQLKSLDGSVNQDHARQLVILKESYVNLQNELKKAKENIDARKASIS